MEIAKMIEQLEVIDLNTPTLVILKQSPDCGNIRAFQESLEEVLEGLKKRHNMEPKITFLLIPSDGSLEIRVGENDAISEDAPKVDSDEESTEGDVPPVER